MDYRKQYFMEAKVNTHRKSNCISVFSQIIICGLFLYSGCTQSSNCMEKISLGYSKEEVKKAIGSPRVIRGAIQNQDGQIIEVWEYRLAMPKEAGQVVGESCLTVITLGASLAIDETSDHRLYWLYFVDGKLAKWGEAGDWQTESKNLYEIRFTQGNKLTAH
jgi:hypothetical protein